MAALTLGDFIRSLASLCGVPDAREPEVRPWLHQLVSSVLPLAERIDAAIKQGRPILGTPYDVFLCSMVDPIEATVMAFMISNLAVRHALETRIESQILPREVRKLAKPNVRRSTISRIAIVLLGIPAIAEHTRSAFVSAGHLTDADEFLACLQGAAAGDPVCCTALCSIAKKVSPRLPAKPGRPVSAATIAHMLVLQFLHSIGKPGAFTESRSYSDAPFTDPRSEATTREFDPKGAKFDPRPAYRMWKRHMAEGH